MLSVPWMDAPEAKVVLGAAVVDDILGLIVLAIVLGLVHASDAGGALSISVGPLLLIVVRAVGFLAASIFLGRLVLVPVMRLVRLARSPSVPVVLGVAYCFLIAALAELAGLADIVGAFTAGLVINDAMGRFLGEQKEQYRIDTSIAAVCTIVVPVFFVYMGLRVDLSAFASLDVLVFAGALSVTAIVSKQACAFGVREGLNRWVVGVGMIPRGEVGLIFAGIGHTVTVAGAPVFSPETFSAIVAMVMLTTLVDTAAAEGRVRGVGRNGRRRASAKRRGHLTFVGVSRREVDRSARGVGLRVLAGQDAQIDTTTPAGRFERERIRERTEVRSQGCTGSRPQGRQFRGRARLGVGAAETEVRQL